jgi:aquaporin related protein
MTRPTSTSLELAALTAEFDLFCVTLSNSLWTAFSTTMSTVASTLGANPMHTGLHAADPARSRSFSIAGADCTCKDLPPPNEKRQTVILEGGLPNFCIPKDKDKHDRSDYRGILQKRMRLKNEVILFLCEYVGTTLFLFFAFAIATQASDRIVAVKKAHPTGPPDTSALQFSSLGFGFSLAVFACE